MSGRQQHIAAHPPFPQAGEGRTGRPSMTDLVATIEGYASIFHVPDMNGDVIAPGAFARRRPAAGIRMLYQHAAEAPIGRWLALEEDARGLYAQGELLLSSETAREVHALLVGGAIDGLSIGFQTVRSRKEKGGARLILEADLWEVSVVTFPMAPGARVALTGPPAPAAVPPAAAGALFAATLKDAARMFAGERRGDRHPGRGAASNAALQTRDLSRPELRRSPRDRSREVPDQRCSAAAPHRIRDDASLLTISNLKK